VVRLTCRQPDHPQRKNAFLAEPAQSTGAMITQKHGKPIARARGEPPCAGDCALAAGHSILTGVD